MVKAFNLPPTRDLDTPGDDGLAPKKLKFGAQRLGARVRFEISTVQISCVQSSVLILCPPARELCLEISADQKSHVQSLYRMSYLRSCIRPRRIEEVQIGKSRPKCDQDRRKGARRKAIIGRPCTQSSFIEVMPAVYELVPAGL